MNNSCTSAKQIIFTGQTSSHLIPLEQGASGEVAFGFHAEPGIYRLSVIVDASESDWESLYVDLYKFHNTGQRTGPWDFNIDSGNNEPLVPSYWVELNGRRLGLWFFQRVSLEDMQHHRFRGNASFHIEQPGEHRIELTPHHPMGISWRSAKLELDPDDRLAPLPPGLRKPEDAAPLAAWSDPDFWTEQRQKLETTHAAYRELLEPLFEGLLAEERNWAGQVVYLVAAHGLMGAEEAIPRALEALDEKIELPHWGNPKEDGYSHDGDFIAVSVMLKLAWGLRMLWDHLGEERRERLIEKLRIQGERFFDLALLNADYWGGSVLQDHGWRSAFGFGTASLYMLGAVPGAEKWLSYALPRIERGLTAMPRDGVVPPSSHCAFFIYVESAIHFRDTLLAMTGDDIFLRAPFHPIIDFLCQTLDEPAEGEGVRCYGRELGGGNNFLNAIASLYGDGRAAWFQDALLRSWSSASGKEEIPHGNRDAAFWGFFSYDPAVKPEKPERPTRSLVHFSDSGWVRFYNDAHQVSLLLRCGPWCGHHAYRMAKGPCDRIGQTPGSGHFELYLDGERKLVTPDGGYRLHSFLATCLLIDDRGQIGDVGYPMGFPSWEHPGEEVESAHWDEQTGCGRVRLNLKPVYPDSADLVLYTRDFLVSPERRIVCRDHVVLNRPHRLSWLFQGTEKDGIHQEEGLRHRFGGEPPLWIEPSTVDAELSSSLHRTDVVWAYVSGNDFQPFMHVRYDTAEEVSAALVDFVVTW